MATFPEDLSDILCNARKTKSLSQRALSERTGVPQSHISKIEQGAVDLRVSSLRAIANALDLEVALVPRKAMPAVKSIARATKSKAAPNHDIIREFKALSKTLSELSSKFETVKKSRLHQEFRNLKQHANLFESPSALRQIRDMLEAKKALDADPSIQDILSNIAEIRNNFAHNQPSYLSPAAPRPAYRLDDDDDE